MKGCLIWGLHLLLPALACGCGATSKEDAPVSGGGQGAGGAPDEPRTVEDSRVTPSGEAWPVPCAASGCPAVLGLAVGDGFGCVLDESRVVRCFWGDVTDAGEALFAIAELPPILALTRGNRSVLARGEDGSITEVLLDSSKQTVRLVPHPELMALSGFGLGSAHVCGIDTAGLVHCWGGNSWSQLGVVDSEETGPVHVPGITDATELVGSGVTTCALSSQGAVTCWGGASFLVGGDAPQDGSPRWQEGLPPLSHLAVGGGRACGVTPGGEAWCWGSDITCSVHGLCNTLDPEPQRASWLDGASRLALTEDTTCGIVAGVIRCDIDAGKRCEPLAGGNQSCTPLPPQLIDQVGGLAHVASISSGEPGRCALLDDGSTWCWAANRGAARRIAF